MADSSDYHYTENELSAMTVAKIKGIASDRGYSMTKTLKADVIAEFLAQQN